MRKGGKEDEGGRPRRRSGWGFIEICMWMSEVFWVGVRGRDRVRHDDCTSIDGSLMMGRDVDTT